MLSQVFQFFSYFLTGYLLASFVFFGGIFEHSLLILCERGGRVRDDNLVCCREAFVESANQCLNHHSTV
jgi:hypothetical protein